MPPYIFVSDVLPVYIFPYLPPTLFLFGRFSSQGSLDLSPWLYVTPADLAPFKTLLLKLGATLAFSAQQLARVLAEMYGAATAQEGGRAVPLSDRQLGQAISVVQVG